MMRHQIGAKLARRTLSRGFFAVRAYAIAALLCAVAGCLPCGTIAVQGSVRGNILDNVTMDAISGAAIGGETITGGEVTDVARPSLPGQGRVGEIAEDGSFTLHFSIFGSACFGPFASPPMLEFPTPEQVAIIVVRDQCEQRFVIDINEDTVVDISFPENVIELKDAILVPPCEE